MQNIKLSEEQALIVNGYGNFICEGRYTDPIRTVEKDYDSILSAAYSCYHDLYHPSRADYYSYQNIIDLRVARFMIERLKRIDSQAVEAALDEIKQSCYEWEHNL